MEYCAKSELHPRAGLVALKVRKTFLGWTFRSSSPFTFATPICRPFLLRPANAGTTEDKSGQKLLWVVAGSRLLTTYRSANL